MRKYRTRRARENVADIPNHENNKLDVALGQNENNKLDVPEKSSKRLVPPRLSIKPMVLATPAVTPTLSNGEFCRVRKHELSDEVGSQPPTKATRWDTTGCAVRRNSIDASTPVTSQEKKDLAHLTSPESVTTYEDRLSLQIRETDCGNAARDALSTDSLVKNGIPFVDGRSVVPTTENAPVVTINRDALDNESKLVCIRSFNSNSDQPVASSGTDLLCRLTCGKTDVGPATLKKRCARESSSHSLPSFDCDAESETAAAKKPSMLSALVRGVARRQSNGASAAHDLPYKPDGLIKQSFSLSTAAGQRLHLVCYYRHDDPPAEKLRSPTTDEKLADIYIPYELYSDRSWTADPSFTYWPSPGRSSVQLSSSSKSSGLESVSSTDGYTPKRYLPPPSSLVQPAASVSISTAAAPATSRMLMHAVSNAKPDTSYLRQQLAYAQPSASASTRSSFDGGTQAMLLALQHQQQQNAYAATVDQFQNNSYALAPLTLPGPRLGASVSADGRPHSHQQCSTAASDVSTYLGPAASHETGYPQQQRFPCVSYVKNAGRVYQVSSPSTLPLRLADDAGHAVSTTTSGLLPPVAYLGQPMTSTGASSNPSVLSTQFYACQDQPNSPQIHYKVPAPVTQSHLLPPLYAGIPSSSGNYTYMTAASSAGAISPNTVLIGCPLPPPLYHLHQAPSAQQQQHQPVYVYQQQQQQQHPNQSPRHQHQHPHHSHASSAHPPHVLINQGHAPMRSAFAGEQLQPTQQSLIYRPAAPE